MSMVKQSHPLTRVRERLNAPDVGGVAPWGPYVSERSWGTVPEACNLRRNGRGPEFDKWCS